MPRYDAILDALYNRVHLIQPEKLRAIQSFLELRADGIDTGGDETDQPSTRFYAAADLSAAHAGAATSGSGKYLAVVPLFGTMVQHGGGLRGSGVTATQTLADELARLDAFGSIKTIVLEVHSPGGQVFGTQELSDTIYEIRQAGNTRIVAAVNSVAASAALWATTATEHVSVTPGGEMGSIGVVVVHQDISAAQERYGVKTSVIAYPPKKAAGNPYEPLSDEVRAELEEEIRTTYGTFVAQVARNRGVTRTKVMSDFGGGGMLTARQAVEAGLADRVETSRSVIAREAKRISSGRQKANANRLASIG